MATNLTDTDKSEIDLAAIDPAAFFAAQRPKWAAQKAEAEEKLKEAKHWLAMFDAAEGKAKEEPKATTPEAFVASISSPSQPRAKGGPAKVLAVIQAHPEGILAADIEKALNEQGEKIGSLGNILNSLKKKGNIKQTSARQPYFPVTKTDDPTPPEAPEEASETSEEAA